MYNRLRYFKDSLKIFGCVSLFGLKLTLASNVNLQHFEVDEASEILPILKQYNLQQTAVFFDFDEVLATTKSCYDGHVYNLLACPDLERTYINILKQIVLSDPSDQQYCIERIKENDYGYEVLDTTVISLISKLKSCNAHVAVCSGLEFDDQKIGVLESVGLTPDVYYSGNPKAITIAHALNKNLNKVNIISTVVLIDNSYEHVIKNFQEVMPSLIKNINSCASANNINIVTIEYKKFTNMMTVDNLQQEFNNFICACDTDTEDTTSNTL